MVTRDDTRESTTPVSKEATPPPIVLSQKDAKQPGSQNRLEQSPISGYEEGESDMLERMNDAAQNSESTPTHGVNGVHSRGYHGVHGVRKSCPRCRHVTCTCNAGKDRRNPVVRHNDIAAPRIPGKERSDGDTESDDDNADCKIISDEHDQRADASEDACSKRRKLNNAMEASPGPSGRAASQVTGKGEVEERETTSEALLGVHGGGDTKRARERKSVHRLDPEEERERERKLRNFNRKGNLSGYRKEKSGQNGGRARRGGRGGERTHGGGERVNGQAVRAEALLTELDPPPWRREGNEHIGKRLRRTLWSHGDEAGSTVIGFADASIEGWLPKEESDFVDERGQPAALWHIEYDDQRIGGEDLEEYELIESLNLTAGLLKEPHLASARAPHATTAHTPAANPTGATTTHVPTPHAIPATHTVHTARTAAAAAQGAGPLAPQLPLPTHHTPLASNLTKPLTSLSCNESKAGSERESDRESARARAVSSGMCHVHPAFDKSSVNSSSAYVINHQHHSINDCHHPPAHTSGAAPHTHARVATGFAGVDKNTAPPARPLQTPQERVPNYTHTHAGKTPYPFASPNPCPANPANPASCRPNGGSGNDMRMGGATGEASSTHANASQFAHAPPSLPDAAAAAAAAAPSAPTAAASAAAAPAARMIVEQMCRTGVATMHILPTQSLFQSGFCWPVYRSEDLTSFKLHCLVGQPFVLNSSTLFADTRLLPKLSWMHDSVRVDGLFKQSCEHTFDIASNTFSGKFKSSGQFRIELLVKLTAGPDTVMGVDVHKCIIAFLVKPPLSYCSIPKNSAVSQVFAITAGQSMNLMPNQNYLLEPQITSALPYAQFSLHNVAYQADVGSQWVEDACPPWLALNEKTGAVSLIIPQQFQGRLSRGSQAEGYRFKTYRFTFRSSNIMGWEEYMMTVTLHEVLPPENPAPLNQPMKVVAAMPAHTGMTRQKETRTLPALPVAENADSSYQQRAVIKNYTHTAELPEIYYTGAVVTCPSTHSSLTSTNGSHRVTNNQSNSGGYSGKEGAHRLGPGHAQEQTMQGGLGGGGTSGGGGGLSAPAAPPAVVIARASLVPDDDTIHAVNAVAIPLDTR